MINSPIQELSMAIIKASRSKADGKMNFRMVASDTDLDTYQTKMSLELFSDFVRRIDNKEEIPDEFKEIAVEDGWDGGMPYLSIAHYKSAGGKNVPGAFEKIYVDGDRLKALGYCFDNKLGKSVFQNLCDDLVGRSSYDHKIRASIGFLDLKHSHGDFVFERKSATDTCPMCVKGVGNKIFLTGQLVHIALTREPVNTRTDISVEERSMNVTTRKEDAISISGDAAEELVEQSTLPASEAIQVRSEETIPEPANGTQEQTVVHTTPEITYSSTVTPGQPKITVTPVTVPESPIDLAVRSLLDEVSKLRSFSDKEAALQSLQPTFNQVAEAIRQEFSTPTDPMVEYSRQVGDLNDRCSRMEASMTSIQADIAVIRASLGNSQVSMSDVGQPSNSQSKPVVRRSLTAPMISLSKYTIDQIGKDREAQLGDQRVVQPALPGVAPKMQELANRSVYGGQG